MRQGEKEGVAEREEVGLVEAEAEAEDDAGTPLTLSHREPAPLPHSVQAPVAGAPHTPKLVPQEELAKMLAAAPADAYDTLLAPLTAPSEKGALSAPQAPSSAGGALLQEAQAASWHSCVV
jgi:hypothetical protein